MLMLYEVFKDSLTLRKRFFVSAPVEIIGLPDYSRFHGRIALEREAGGEVVPEKRPDLREIRHLEQAVTAGCPTGNTLGLQVECSWSNAKGNKGLEADLGGSMPPRRWLVPR